MGFGIVAWPFTVIADSMISTPLLSYLSNTAGGGGAAQPHGLNGDLGARIATDRERMRVLRAVEELRLPDGWIGAGFIRDAVWDHLHGRPASPPAGDVDVVWFDRSRATEREDLRIQRQLRAREPAVAWSVKNQARMHARNGDAPYASTEDALRHWPETATAVAVRLVRGDIEILAPFGLDDLFSLIVRPTPAFAAEKRSIVDARVREKRWPERWPRLHIASL